MSRGLAAANLAHVQGQAVHEVALVKLEFDTPAYAHSGIGDIPFGGNTYLGVGDFGSVSSIRESQALGPAPFELKLSGVDSTLLAAALDSGKFGDRATVYFGYRQDDGDLVADPVMIARGTVDYINVSRGTENDVVVVVQHDLAVLRETSGGKFTSEDQRQRYAADTGFKFVHAMAGLRLLWGGVSVSSAGGGGASPLRPPGRREA